MWYFLMALQLLAADGVLAVAGLTPGYDIPTRVVAGAWSVLHSTAPSVVGGCRAQRLEPYLVAAGFDVVERRAVSGPLMGLFPLASEVLVARKKEST